MITEVHHWSQARAQDYIPNPSRNIAMISITGTPSYDKEANLKNGYKIVLRLKFDDIDQEILEDSRKKFKYYGINDDQGQQILNLVKEIQQDTEKWLLLVHCHAGVSRSAAVAKYIKDKFNLPIDDLEDDYSCHNNYVYDLLKKLDDKS